MNIFYNIIVKRVFMPIVLIVLLSYNGKSATHFTTVWEGENGQNHMNFLVVSAISEDLSLSVDDEIAVFSGSNCVGATKLTKAINPADYTTFLNIQASQDDGSNNGFINGDTIVFRIWDNLNQREMVAKSVTYGNQQSTWSISGKYSAGATSVVELISYQELTQTIDLVKGYNLVSTYVTPKNPDACAVTQCLRDQSLLVKVQDESGNSYENWGSFGGWINRLGPIESTEGYKIKVVNNCSFQVTGRPIALPLDISLQAGWNIISFPRADEINALSVIQSLIDQNTLIKVQDENGRSIENWGIFGGWKNNIGSFGCCKAYKVKMSANAILTIQKNYLKSAVIPFQTEKTEYFSTEIEGNGTDHMNINLLGLRELGLSEGDELAAFDGNICVGTLKISKEQVTSGASLIASFSTDNVNKSGFKAGDLIQLHVWNHLTGNESIVQTETLSGLMVYEMNGTVLVKMKSLTTEIKNLENEISIDVFPNPSVGKVNVRFSQLPDVGSRIDILDLTGKKVETRLISNTSEVFNLETVPKGIYIVKTILGSFEKVNKLIIK